MPNTTPMQHFDKYDFVKSFVAIAKTANQKKEKEKEALVIAKAIEQHQEEFSQNLATKVDIELIRKETESITKEIELLRKETDSIRKETESIKKETESIKKETESVKKEVVLLRKDTEFLGKDVEFFRQEFKKDMLILEQRLTIKLTVIMAALMTFLPLATEFLKRSF